MSDGTKPAETTSTTAPPAAATTAPVAETKPADAPPAVEASKTESTPGDAKPTDIELKFADGLKVDAAFVDGFKGVAKEIGLDSEKAQKLADFYASTNAAAAKKANADFEALQASWAAELKADKAFGGAKFEANARTAQLALAKYGGDELAKVLEATGLANHPALVRAFFKVGQAMAEDSVAGASGARAAGDRSDAELLRALYPTMHAER